MSDPAIEAWMRSAARTSPLDAPSAAREALKPIRELHQPVTRTDMTDERWVECKSCCAEIWPCETAKRIYTTEELGQ